MKPFEDLWREISGFEGPVVQDYNELQYVFNLLKGCKSYLEVGTAEGKSLYVISHAIDPDAEITYIDLGERHTTPKRNNVLAMMANKNITEILGDSNSYFNYEKVKDKKFDAVFIDAGHTLFNVLIDACFYGPLATKYLIFHDVQIPDVNKAFEWYSKSMPCKRSYKVVNSDVYGYGIIEL